MKSTEFLQSAMDVQKERGEQYDKPSGERSMGATVLAFNAITGRDLSEAEGWLLLQTLKDVRQWQNPDRYHHDSALDGVAYSALKAEALSEQCGQVERKSEDPQSIWSRAPNWAEWVAMDKDGRWYWYENEPRPAHSGWIPTLKLASTVVEVGFEVATMEDDWTRTLSRRPQ